VNRIARQGLIRAMELGHCEVAAESSTVITDMFSLTKEVDEYKIITSELTFFRKILKKHAV
jgi:hypothetical protein